MPINIGPVQTKHHGWTTHPLEAGYAEDSGLIGITMLKDCIAHLSINERISGSVDLFTNLLISRWTLGDQSIPNRSKN